MNWSGKIFWSNATYLLNLKKLLHIISVSFVERSTNKAIYDMKKFFLEGSCIGKIDRKEQPETYNKLKDEANKNSL